MKTATALLLLCPFATATHQSCIPHKASHGFTCLCTSTACDSIEPLNWSSVSANTAVIYQTAKEVGDEVGDRLRRFTKSMQNSTGRLPARTITFDSSITYQTIRGFGNAFTDAAAINYHRAKNKSLFLEQYWGKDGLGFSVGRVPIASCDFSTSSWSYDDVDNDQTLEHFSIEHDTKYKIPLLKDAMNKAYNDAQRFMELFASPWAPPYWMTNTNSTIHNPTLQGGPDGEVAQIYANYLVEFFRRYKNEHSIEFWGMTAQNEPAGNTGAWQGLKFTPEQQRDFIKNVLGPTFQKNNVTKFVDILMLDDQRSHLNKWTDVILSDKDAAKFISGIGVHWYASVEDLLPHFDQMNDAHEKYPDKYIMATEACEGFLPWSQGPYLGSFSRGETYAHDILQDLNNWAVGWTDWNALLNMTGGPNWANNEVDCPILLDDDNETYHKQPMYYALGHFSKFILPGSVRIQVNSTSTHHIVEAPMEATGFLRPDGLIVMVILNRDHTSLSSDTKYTIILPNGNQLAMDVPANSFQTIIFSSASNDDKVVASK
jgi:glucosylceramidase